MAATLGPTVFGSGTFSATGGSPRAEAAESARGPYNILFILTDQERYFRPGELPKDYRLPAHERLAKKGIIFENHLVNSCVCTPSRSHVDIAPTLVSMTHAEADKKTAITKALPGKDFSALLAAPEKAGHDAIRDGVLFCYNMFAYIDGDFLEKVVGVLQQPGGKAALKEAVKTGEMRPDLTKRGAIRSVFDGRYKFVRYFSPKQHNRPNSLEALVKLNDVELFDLQTDPLELKNLALDRTKQRDLLDGMSAKLNALIDKEVGEGHRPDAAAAWTAAGSRRVP